MTTFGRIREQRTIEEKLANSFMLRVMQRLPTKIKKPDERRDRKRPDFTYYYGSLRYHLELKRWLTPELNRLQRFLDDHIAQPLSLPGTFALDIPLEILNKGQMSLDQAQSLVNEINNAIGSDVTCMQLSLGKLIKIRDDGHTLVPMVVRQEVLFLRDGEPETKALYQELTKILIATDKKFKRYRSTRILLLDISQCPLDIEYHAGRSKEGPGIIDIWLAERPELLKRVDYVCVGQMGVWDASMNRIVTGHKYVDTPPPHYTEVWRRSGLPRIFDSYHRSN